MSRFIVLAALAIFVSGCQTLPKQQREKEVPSEVGTTAPNGENSPFQ